MFENHKKVSLAVIHFLQSIFKGYRLVIRANRVFFDNINLFFS